MAETYSLSTDEENYNGQYDSIEEAIVEAIQCGNGIFWVGLCVKPPAPEGYFDAQSYFEHVSDQDEYMGDWGKNWLVSTREQDRELEAEVAAVIGKWLDRHNLRPKFWNISDPIKYVVKNGVASRA